MYKESSEEILKRMKEYVDSDTSIMEGTLMHDALAPIAYEFEDLKEDLDEVLKKVFIQTAYENDFDKEVIARCAEMGVYRKEGKKAAGTVTFYGAKDTEILAGTLVQTKSAIQFKTIEDSKIKDNGEVDVMVEALEIGNNYNVQANTIIEMPVQLINITKITNKNPIDNGVNIESIEDLYKRYKLKVTTPATSGNAGHYKLWATEVNGVGDAVVIPTWNGPGTVKVIVLDSNKHTPTQTIIDNVTKHIEANRPIGAAITVTGTKEIPINISVNLQLASGATLEDVKIQIETGVKSYLESLAFKDPLVRYTRIANLLLDIPPIIDYTGFTVNRGTSNIEIKQGEVAVLGSVVVSSAT